jgi:hypothetical protein
MSLAQLTALRYVTPLREGGSLPAVVDTDGGCFVMKFRGAGQGPTALVAELLSGELARALGLPIPAQAFIDLAPEFGRGEPDPEIQDLLRASEGRNIGLAYLSGSVAFDPVADAPVDGALASDIVWFDAFVTNVDRTARNTNILVWQHGLHLIDHGASLYFHHNWAGYDSRIHNPFPAIRQHVLLPFATDLAAADARLAPRLTADLIAALVANLPDDWLVDHGPFPDADAHRAAYLRYLTERLAGPRAFVTEALDARADLV